MLTQNRDTITAIATPAGNGAIAIVRVSGPEAILVVENNFEGRIRLSDAHPGKQYLGNFYFNRQQSDSAEIYDQVMAVVFKAPHSYTTENLVEIYCHGSRFIAEKIVKTLLSRGARLAEPGEFTFRAFVNGRIDLSQAEAIVDLIKAESDVEIKNSLQQLEGYFSGILKKLRGELLEVISLLELELDFSEEEVEFVQREQILKMINDIETEVQRYLQSFDRAKIIREGARVVLVGKPNVGKSSLLNVLLKENRAIVTEFPGTTRDILEEQVTIDGTRFCILDTAGICSATNPIEVEGIRRTRALMNEADILLVVLDGSALFDADDEIVLTAVEKYIHTKECVFIINKKDLPRKIQLPEPRKELHEMVKLEVSALTNDGISELGTHLSALAKTHYPATGDDYLVTNIRHQKSLSRALESIQHAQKTIDEGLSGEFIVSDLREASENLGKIIGAITSEEVLNTIFEKFCIGK